MKSLTWHYVFVLGTGEFIGRGIQTISKFESVVKHIQKYEQEIESILKSIATAKLLKFPVKPNTSDELPGTTMWSDHRML